MKFLLVDFINSLRRLRAARIFSQVSVLVGVLRHMENNAPSLKIFRAKFTTSALYNAEIKIGGKTRFENLLKQLFHSPLLDTK